jgi:hypothetical protein
VAWDRVRWKRSFGSSLASRAASLYLQKIEHGFNLQDFVVGLDADWRLFLFNTPDRTIDL